MTTSFAMTGLAIATIVYNGTVADASLERIRQLAREHNCKEIYYNPTSRVISFCKHNESKKYTRINVYYTTGTVGICLCHPIMEKRTQLFHQRMTMQDLSELLMSPQESVIKKGYYINMSNTIAAAIADDGPCMTEKEEMKAKVKRLQLTINVLNTEIAKLEKAEQEEREEKERQKNLIQEENARKARQDKLALRGNKFDVLYVYVIFEDLRSRLNESVKCVAWGVEHYAILYDSGKLFWKGNVPDNLRYPLANECLDYIALSAFDHDNYFVKVNNYNYLHQGPRDFDYWVDIAEEDGREIRSIAFGPDGCWVIVYTDGDTFHDVLPTSLENYLNTTKKGVLSVSIDEYYGWFVAHIDGSVAAMNLRKGIGNKLINLRRNGKTVRNVTFGPDEQNLIRYS